jgi:hypothetical protein
LNAPDFLDLPPSNVNHGYASGSYRRPVTVSSSPQVDKSGDLQQFLVRFALNAQLGLSKVSRKYLMPPIRHDGHDNFHQSGRDRVTRPDGVHKCGAFKRFVVCDDVEAHEGVTFNGEDCSHKIVVLPQVHSCNSRGCPVCHIRGYSIRLALSIKAKLDTAAEVYQNKVEALVVSPPERDRELPMDVLEPYMERKLVRLGVSGVTMRHGRRYSEVHGDLFWSPHWHCIVLINGGFDVCRDCSNYEVARDKICDASLCRVCKGFMGRVLRECERDGWIVKVLKPRKSPDYGASYVLSHVTFNANVRRDYVVRYFGLCANKRLKSKPVEKRVTCPACGSVAKKMVFNYACDGRDKIVTDVASPLFKSVVLMAELDESGRPYFLDCSHSVDEGG